MVSALAEQIFAYVSCQLGKDHPDGDGCCFIYLSEINKIVLQYSMKNTTPETAVNHRPAHGGRPSQSGITHPQMVAQLIKSGEEIKHSMTPTGAKLMHATFGISGEAGELLDAVKKHIIYGKPLDRENVIEELGDLEFYLEDLRATLQVSREETIEANMSKLAKRYPGFNYTDACAITRADKEPLSSVALRQE